MEQKVNRQYRPSTLNLAAFLAALLVLGACDSSSVFEFPPETGGVSFALSVGDNDELDEIAYVVENETGEVVVSQTLDVSDEESVGFQLVLPEGHHYRLTATATTRSGASCAGETIFDVEAGEVSDVALVLLCSSAPSGSQGGARVEVTVEAGEACPEIASASASHLTARVGKPVQLGSEVTGGAQVAWSSTGGSIADPNASDTTFVCEQQGDVTLTLTVLADAGCESSASFAIACTAADQDPTVVEYSGGHGDLAMQLSPTAEGGFEVVLEAEGATIDGAPGTDGEFGIEQVVVVTDATFTRPEADNGFFAPLCVEQGESVFWLPQGNTDAASNGVPFMGIALETEAGMFVGDEVHLELVGVTSPSGNGHYALWKDGFPPDFSMSSCDGIDAGDELVVPVGHDHFNMGLAGEAGDWLVTYEVHGDLAAGGSVSQQFSIRYRTVNSGDSGGSEELGLTRGRLVTSSATLAEAYVVDLDTLAVSTVPVAGPGAAVQGSGGTSPFVWIANYPTGPVEILDVGSYITPHTDHFHLDKTDPALHPFSIEGPQPTHVVEHDGLVAAYFDGLGEAHMFSEAQLSTGGDVDVEVLATNMPHHGVALSWHEHLLITEGEVADPPDPQWGETIPVGVAVYDLEDPSAAIHQTPACTKLHGETAQPDYVAYGCDEGVLVVTHDGDVFSSEVLDYPAGAIGRAYGLKSHASSSLVVGDLGPALVSIDPISGTVTSHSLPAAQKSFVFEDGDHLLVLGADGSLYRVALADFSVEGEPLPLVDAFGDLDAGMVLVAADRLYLMDSRDTAVLAVDLDAWELLSLSIELPSAPNGSFATAAAVSQDW